MGRTACLAHPRPGVFPGAVVPDWVDCLADRSYRRWGCQAAATTTSGRHGDTISRLRGARHSLWATGGGGAHDGRDGGDAGTPRWSGDAALCTGSYQWGHWCRWRGENGRKVRTGGGRRRPEVEEKWTAPLELGRKKIGAERGWATLYSAGDRGVARGGSWPGACNAHRRCTALPAAPRRDAHAAGAGEPGGWRWAGPVQQCVFVFIIVIIFKLIQIWISQKWSSVGLKFSNKIFTCRYWHKEQISSLVFFTILNGIWIKIQRTKSSQIWLILNSRDYEALDLDRIWHVGP
jgi:hypothetical protein